MTLTEICIRRPVTAWAILIAVVLFGVAGLLRIGISHMPDVDFPVVTVSVSWNGASPESIEHDVVDVLEDAFADVDGVDSLTSSSGSGVAVIAVNLGVNQNVDTKVNEIQRRIAQVESLLPKDVDPPVVMKASAEDWPIMWLSVSGPYTMQQLSDCTRYQIKDRLQQIPGVGNIQLGGWQERNIRLWFRQEALDAHALTMVEVIDRLRREHLELPAGHIDTPSREIDVRVLGEALDLEAMRGLMVGGSPDRPVRLSDVALVEDGFADFRSLCHNDGASAIGVGVSKLRGENAVAVAARVIAALEPIREQLPPGMHVDVNYDDTVFISRSVHEVELELGLSILLTSLVCLVFLGSLAATINVVLAIPMSILGTIAALQWFGYTLNSMTLLALALVVGIVVDDAIMVQENIARHRELGHSPIDASRLGTGQITFAAMASTVAVIAIFLPVVFMKGSIGKFFMQFGLALCIAVGLSFLEAMTLAPARSAQFLALGSDSPGALARASAAAFARLSAAYRWVLSWSLRLWWLTLPAAALVFMVSLYAATRLPAEFTPSQDQSILLVSMKDDAGANLAEISGTVTRFETWLLARREVKHDFAIIGDGGNGGGLNSAVFFVTLVQPRQRALTQLQFAEAIRGQLRDYVGCTSDVIDLSKAASGGGHDFPIEFALRGYDWDQLVAAARTMSDGMRSQAPLDLGNGVLGAGSTVVPATLFSDVDSDYRLGRAEMAIEPDRARAQDLGIAVGDIAEAINTMLGGIKIGKFTIGGRRLDIRADLIGSDRASADALAHCRIRTAHGDLVPLESVVHMRERSVLDSITHRNHMRAITITANTSSDQGKAMAAVERLAKGLPAGVSMSAQGSSADLQDTGIQFLVTFLLGLLMAYLILAAQFESFWHPLTVFTVLPLAMAGAFFALWLAHQSINMFSIIGILLLMGIVKKNSIILVDYAERLRRAGMSAREAMMEAGLVRLRPILMTSIATMAAAVPTALGLGAGGEARKSMAIAVFGGVALSTLLSLMVVPAFYHGSASFWGAVGRLRQRAWRAVSRRPARSAA